MTLRSSDLQSDRTWTAFAILAMFQCRAASYPLTLLSVKVLLLVFFLKMPLQRIISGCTMLFKDGWLLEYFVWQYQNIVKESEKKFIPWENLYGKKVINLIND